MSGNASDGDRAGRSVGDTRPLHVTVWNEFIHERRDPTPSGLYPDGMHTEIAAAIRTHLGENVTVRCATLEEPEHGLPEPVLRSTDVLTWWGHCAHDAVDDEVVTRVAKHVLAGMGLVVLHSGHYSKLFRRLMGTECSLRWRNEGDQEVVWSVNPGHPICEGVPSPFVIARHEMYGEYFDIPQPDDLVFISSFSGGEVFRSGCCFRRGKGRVFYFSPGDQDYPVYYDANVRRVIANAVRWCAPISTAREPPASGRSGHRWYQPDGVREETARAQR
jgi:trehalose utilization protein